MKKITSLVLASTIILLANDPAPKNEDIHWGYTGHASPDQWGELIAAMAVEQHYFTDSVGAYR